MKANRRDRVETSFYQISAGLEAVSVHRRTRKWCSKGLGLIQHFSEDIGVTVFRDDPGIPASVDKLAALSGKKRAAALDAIKEACEAYINGPLAERLATICAEACARTGLGQDALTVKADAHDRQTLLLGYQWIGFIDRPSPCASASRSHLKNASADIAAKSAFTAPPS